MRTPASSPSYRRQGRARMSDLASAKFETVMCRISVRCPLHFASTSLQSTAVVGPSSWVSATVLITLLVLLAASLVTFWVLIERATSRRQWVALSEWSRQRGFAFRRCDPAQPPAPLDALR